MDAWNDWYHVMGHTYGTWLPGDPKGFRTRHHREHVEGDYRNPPPKGKYDGLHESAKRAMKREPVFLDPAQRRRAPEEMVASFQRRNMGLQAFAVGAIHFHGLLQCHDHYPKWWIGVAKKESSHYCKQTGHAPVGGFWATGTKSLPIEGPSHFVFSTGYILDHVKKGAAIWEPPGMEAFDPDSLLLE